MDGFCKWNNDVPLGCRPKLIEYSSSCEDLAAALKPTLKERLHQADFNVEQLEIRFNLEDEYLANGLSIRKKAFSLRFIVQRSVSQKHIVANIILSHPLLS